LVDKTKEQSLGEVGRVAGVAVVAGNRVEEDLLAAVVEGTGEGDGDGYASDGDLEDR